MSYSTESASGNLDPMGRPVGALVLFLFVTQRAALG
jgi:hypothetical protein